MFITFCVDSGYLFEGHLTVDQEPPQPDWMVQANLLAAAARLFEAESSQGLATNETTEDDAASVLEMLRNRLEEVVPLVFIQSNIFSCISDNPLFGFIFSLLNINMTLNF
jgi:hypothetical protein